MTSHTPSATATVENVSQDEAIAWALGVMQSAREGDAGRLESLLARGLSPDLRNGKGDSLLMLACYHGHVDAARVLLAGRANPDLANDRHQTPLAGAAFRGSLEIAQLLLDHGATPDAAGPDGRTALMTAAMFNRTALIELLLAHGADRARRDIEGHSAGDLAGKLGAADAVEMLARLTRREGSLGESRVAGGAALAGPAAFNSTLRRFNHDLSQALPTMKLPSLLSSVLIGAVASARSMTPMAAIAAARLAGRRSPGQLLLLDRPLFKFGALAMGVAELFGDKMKAAPDRTVPLGLLARVSSAAIAGAALAPPGRERAGAVAAVATAVPLAYLTLSGRERAMSRIGQTRSGLIEDAMIVAAGAAVIAWSMRPKDERPG